MAQQQQQKKIMRCLSTYKRKEKNASRYFSRGLNAQINLHLSPLSPFTLSGISNRWLPWLYLVPLKCLSRLLLLPFLKEGLLLTHFPAVNHTVSIIISLIVLLVHYFLYFFFFHDFLTENRLFHILFSDYGFPSLSSTELLSKSPPSQISTSSFFFSLD